MPIEIDTWRGPLLEIVTTYILHSSLFLGATWLMVRLLRPSSPSLREMLWKGAAIAGILTTPIQLALAPQTSAWVLTFSTAVAAEAVAESTESSSPVPTDPASATDDDIDAELAEWELLLEEPSVSKWQGTLDDVEIDPAPTAIIPFEAATVFDENGMPADDFAAKVTGESDSEAGLPASDPVKPGEKFSTAQLVDSTSRMIERFGTTVLPILLVIVAAGAVIAVLQSMLFSLLMRQHPVITHGAARAELNRLLERLNIDRRVVLLGSEDSRQPAAFGTCCWYILIPIDLAENISREELVALLAHELAHLVRGDAWWLAFGRALCTVGFAQPLNFLARREWQRAAELQCDNWAVRHAADPIALARCLTTVAEWNFATLAAGSTLSAVGSRSQLSDRVERLLDDESQHDPWSRGIQRWLPGAVVLAAAAAVISWGPRAVYSSPEPDDEIALPSAIEILSTDAPEPLVPLASADVEEAAPLVSNEEIDIERATLKNEMEQLEQELDLLATLLERGDVSPSLRLESKKFRDRLQKLQIQMELIKSIQATTHGRKADQNEEISQ